MHMDAGEFFERFARLMKDNPPAAADAPMVRKLASIGIEPGKDFDIKQADPRIARALNRSMAAFKLLEKGVQKLKTKDGWIVIPKDFADYGTDYLTRAGIAMIGLGGIQRPDVVYPTAFLDEHDKPLDAANRYVLHFEKNQLPPAQATWSVAMYDPDGYYVPNAMQPVCPLGVDAAQIQCRRLSRSLPPDRFAGRGQGGQLAAGPEARPIQPDHPRLLAEAGGPGWHLESAGRKGRQPAIKTSGNSPFTTQTKTRTTNKRTRTKMKTKIIVAIVLLLGIVVVRRLSQAGRDPAE